MRAETTIFFIAYGEPVAKAKVFRNKHTDKIHGVTPAKTRAYEHSVSMQALKHRPAKLLEGPLLLGVKVVRSIPKGISAISKDYRFQYQHHAPD